MVSLGVTMFHVIHQNRFNLTQQFVLSISLAGLSNLSEELKLQCNISDIFEQLSFFLYIANKLKLRNIYYE